MCVDNSVYNYVHDQFMSVLCVYNLDGASLMQDLLSDTMKLILDHAPCTIQIHCVEHKLELAVPDVVKRITYLKQWRKLSKGFTVFAITAVRISVNMK